MTLVNMRKRIEVLKALDKGGSQSRTHLMKKHVNLAWTSLYDVLHRLEGEGLISKFTIPVVRQGRPIVYWQITEKGKKMLWRGGKSE